MLTVIGKVGCTQCTELKYKLTRKNVEFEYLVFEDIPRGPRQIYAKLIREENGGHFPLVLDEDGQVVQEGLDG